jgi:Na+/H+-dicarboxylate symporter
MRKLALHWQILIAIVLAVIVGSMVKSGTTDDFAPNVFGVSFVAMFDYIGSLFLNALKMIIVPLITSSIIVGVAGIGSGGNLGSLGGKTLLFYATTTLAAILVGLIIINVVQPGISDGQPAGDLLALEADTTDISARVEGKGVGDVAEVFKRMIPAKFNFWNGVFHVMMSMTEWIMKFAPIGVFGLVAEVMATAGFSAAKPLAIFAICVFVALVFHAFATLPAMLRFIGKVKPYKTMAGASPAMLTAFSTASSSATLPVTMDSLEDNIGVSNKVSSFVLPLGATVNMNGTALYECAAAIFLAQAYGLDLTFGQQFAVVVIALLTSIGVAGVPSASLVAIAIILAAIGLPIEAIGVLMVFDRILDMCRTSINVWGDACCATIVARLEGERTYVALEGAAEPEEEPT